MTFEAEIKGNKIKLRTTAPLRNAGIALLRTFNEVAKQADIFQKGFMLDYGWARYFLEEKNDDGDKYFLVTTLDYQNNPNKRIEDCAIPLTVQNMQMDTNSVAGVEKPERTLFKDTVDVLRSAVDAEDVYMVRTDPAKNGDSGWYFGLVDDPDAENHTDEEIAKAASLELLRFRGEALRVLQMPVGTYAVFHKVEMTGLFDKDNNPLKFTTAEDRRKAREERKAAAEKAEAEKDGE